MSPVEKLIKLEESGKYVFHGSPDKDLELLEPRQSKHVPDLEKPKEEILDGMPAVSATPYAEIAAFRAIINRKNVTFDHTSGFGITGGQKEFTISSEKVLEEVKDKKGYVYVFDKNNFEPYSRDGHARQDSMEWRSHESVKPLDVVEVTSEDLPPREMIKIIA